MQSIIARVLLVAALLAGLSCDDKNEGKGSCGDGILEPGEECDGNQLGTHSCQEQGF